jgi:antitoxin ParD1/3/4
MQMREYLINFAKVEYDSFKWRFPMAAMNVSLPYPMKDWVEAQARTGRYSNASDYVRDLIRRDQTRSDKIAAMQSFVEAGLQSGVGIRSKDELFAEAMARASKSRVLSFLSRRKKTSSPSPSRVSVCSE